MTKICKDCKYHRSKCVGFEGSHFCSRHYVFTHNCLVTGIPQYKGILRCHNERYIKSIDWVCGKEGKFFEEKAPEPSLAAIIHSRYEADKKDRPFNFFRTMMSKDKQ